MKLVEQMKMFSEETPKELEIVFNGWLREVSAMHLNVPALRGIPVVIHDRVLAVDRTTKNTLYVLSVFYDHYDMETHETGPDRGGHIHGASAFQKK
jgi:hypothetical protein